MFFNAIKNYLSIVLIVNTRKYTSIVAKSITINGVKSVVATTWSCVGKWISWIVNISRRVIQWRRRIFIWYCMRINNRISINKFENKTEHKNFYDALGYCFPIKQCITHSKHNEIGYQSRKNNRKKSFHCTLIKTQFFLIRLNNIFRIFIVIHRHILTFQYLSISKFTPINQENIT